MEHQASPFQNAQPTFSPHNPFFGIPPRADKSGVAFLQAPIRIIDQFSRSHPDNAEGSQGRGYGVDTFSRGWKFKGKPLFDIGPAKGPLGIHLQEDQVDQGDQGKGSYQAGNHSLNSAVAPQKQDHGGENRYRKGPYENIRPGVRQRFRDGAGRGRVRFLDGMGQFGQYLFLGRLVESRSLFSKGRGNAEGLTDTSDNSTHLAGAGYDHEEPEPNDKVRPGNFRARQTRNATQCGASGKYDVSSDFDLNKNFDDTADDNDPHQPEAGLSAGGSGGDQLSRSDNGTRHDQPRTQFAEDSPYGCGSGSDFFF